MPCVNWITVAFIFIPRSCIFDTRLINIFYRGIGHCWQSLASCLSARCLIVKGFTWIIVVPPRVVMFLFLFFVLCVTQRVFMFLSIVGGRGMGLYSQWSQIYPGIVLSVFVFIFVLFSFLFCFLACMSRIVCRLMWQLLPAWTLLFNLITLIIFWLRNSVLTLSCYRLCYFCHD